MALLRNNHIVQVRSFKNIYGVNTLAVTIEYRPSTLDKLLNQTKTRSFAKTEGTPWVEKIGTKFVEIKSIDENIILNEVCSFKGHVVPCN